MTNDDFKKNLYKELLILPDKYFYSLINFLKRDLLGLLLTNYYGHRQVLEQILLKHKLHQVKKIL
jgi:hypothetical protein